jgi:4-carboxymuconolactone decarboxylase
LPRITLPSPDTMTTAQLRVYEEITSGPRDRIVGPLRAAIHCPELADRWQKLGALLRFETSVAARFSELAILVTARRWNSQVEWHVHAQCALEAGVPDDIIAAIRRGTAPQFEDSIEVAVYNFAVELQTFGEVRTETYNQVLETLGTVGIVELTAIIGYYTMVAMTLNAHEIPMPEGIPPPLPVLAHRDNGQPGGQTALPRAMVRPSAAEA